MSDDTVDYLLGALRRRAMEHDAEQWLGGPIQPERVQDLRDAMLSALKRHDGMLYPGNPLVEVEVYIERRSGR
jgi:hypothetical protein